jgi:hypothetical protein
MLPSVDVAAVAVSANVIFVSLFEQKLLLYDELAP